MPEVCQVAGHVLQKSELKYSFPKAGPGTPPNVPKMIFTAEERQAMKIQMPAGETQDLESCFFGVRTFNACRHFAVVPTCSNLNLEVLARATHCYAPGAIPCTSTIMMLMIHSSVIHNSSPYAAVTSGVAIQSASRLIHKLPPKSSHPC